MNTHSVAVVVGRFQVASLHAGHRYLLDTASRECEGLLVLIGTREGIPTRQNPLDYETRKRMLEVAYPKAIIRPVYDHPSNEEWSRRLDELVEAVFPGCEAVLYGSRDCFAAAYSGRFTVRHVTAVPRKNGTESRKSIGKKVLSSRGFRAGQIYAQENRFPVSYQAVDTAVIRPSTGEVLLAGKSIDGQKMRFIGGFVDPGDATLESAAAREVHEEVGHIEVADLRYVGSFRIADYRYRGSSDGVMSALFVATYIFGAPRPQDDIEKVAWAPLSALPDLLIPNHIPLGEALLAYMSAHLEILHSSS